jgi:hypothetical protein
VRFPERLAGGDRPARRALAIGLRAWADPAAFGRECGEIWRLAHAPRGDVAHRRARSIERKAACSTVEDDGEPMDRYGGGEGTGVGLRNVRDRLTARYRAEAARCLMGAEACRRRVHVVTLNMPLMLRWLLTRRSAP